MDEDTKKELQELVSGESKERPYLKKSPQEETEELIHELLKERESAITDSKGLERSYKKFLFLGASIFLVVILIIGLILIWRLLTETPGNKTKTSETTDTIEKAKSDEKRDAQENASVTPANDTRQALIGKRVEEKKYNYYLKLSDFLFPLDERTFLKVDVLVYFENYEEYHKAQRREFELRRFFTHELKRLDKNVWKKEEQIKTLEERLKDNLNKGSFGFLSAKIVLEGVLLKT
ncbi:MAG: hypothetical protein N2Z40_05220 [Caldimicrobium sp.]|nr:hypothetical protein [Caldimicrobium sp.]MCX7613602.1 hypothetical protein [Caldimicrobium sp.]MDW8183081.1 hypothetical protein [Caldimicrobium sp.]